MIRMICFDMDGTLADLYGVKDWLPKLENQNVTPYEQAKPLVDVDALAEILVDLMMKDIEIRIITWLAKDSTPHYKKETRQAKIDWLEKYGIPYDKIHAVQYGTTKADCVRKYLAEDETAILIDDNVKICNGWTLGETINPPTDDIIEILKELLKNE